MNEIIDLNGPWNIYVDRDKKTDECTGFPPLLFESGIWECTVAIPGCWESIGISKLFGGPVWYRKEIFIPDISDKGNRWVLNFGGVSYYCEVYVNSEWAGSHEGLWDPFEVDITSLVNPNDVNMVYIKTYKPTYGENDRFYYRETLTGFIPDVASTFGGIWKPVYLIEKSLVFIKHIKIQPNIHEGKVGVWVHLSETGGKTERKNLALDISIVSQGGNAIAEETVALYSNANSIIYCEIDIDHMILWDTENPYLYILCSVLRRGGIPIDKSTRRFGMREISMVGDKIVLNDRPIYIRGLLHWGYYPDIICPNPTRSVIEDEIQKAKDMGFNLIKHCLYLASSEYYDIADEKGMLIWQELPLWQPKATPRLEQRIRDQYPRIIESIAAHPSLFICTLGCELDADIGADLLKEMYHEVKNSAGDILVRDNSGSGECYGGLPVDFADFYDYHFYADIHYIENLMEAFTPQWRAKKPWLYGEFCDFDTFRDTRELSERLDHSQLWWLSSNPDQNPLVNITDVPATRQASLLRQYKIEDDAAALKAVSYKQSFLHRKFTIEQVRRFPEISGYVITAFRDVPIATSGLFDDMMNPKFGAEFNAFNADVVLTLAWGPRRIWTNGGDRVLNVDRYNYWSDEDTDLHVIISNYSDKVIKEPNIRWRLLNERSDAINEGHEISHAIIEPGTVKELTMLHIKMPDIDKACSFNLHVAVDDGISYVNNDWRFWVYPNIKSYIGNASVAIYDPSDVLYYLKDRYGAYNIEDPDNYINYDVVITTRITSAIEHYISSGGKAFYIQRTAEYLPVKKCPFWREAVKRLYDHDVLRQFPNDGFTDLQFFGLATDTAIDTMAIDEHRFDGIQPIIRRVDARSFYVTDYMIEIKKGRGSMIVTTLQLEGGTGKQPNSLEYNKAAIYLIGQIISYLLNKV